MSASTRVLLVAPCAIVAGLVARPATALPTMIRLGYANCAACHLSPQGGGPLNRYGKSIDEAQSLRAADYRPSDSQLVRLISLHGRVSQDVRTVLQQQTAWTGGGSDGVFRPRFMYRNVTALGRGFRVAATVSFETESAPRPPLSYDPAIPGDTVFVNTALVHFRPSEAIEFAAGRDQLPSGVNVPDAGAYIKARNRLGYYDAPLQVKMFWGGKRFQVMPFAYAPSGNEPDGERESGGGTLAEFDLLGHGRTIVGVTLVGGQADNGGRRTVGGYARLGFGPWGVLAEHDVTDRTRDAPLPISFRQQASYAQVFWAVREWLVASLTGEHLTVDEPHRERLAAGKVGLGARLSSLASVAVSVKVQRNLITGQLSRSVAVQAAFKTVY